MKRLLIASAVIALIAVLLNFPFTRGRHHTADDHSSQTRTAQIETHPGAGAAAAAAGIRTAVPGDVPLAARARPEPGARLNVPGLPPILLAGRNGAPSEKTIDAVIERTDLSDPLKARILIQMLHGLPPEVLARAAEEAVTRLPDADYTAVLRPTLINPQTHGMAMSVLFADLMRRQDATLLPILLSIAQDPKHPYSQNARDNLQFLLRQDFGNDWARWNEAIRIRLGASGK